MDDSEIMCDEVIDADVEAKSNDEAKPNNEETKTENTKLLYFDCFFINYYSVIDHC